MQERVAVTGIGVFSPIGNDTSEVVRSLQEGRSGIESVEKLDLEPPSALLQAKIVDFLEKAQEAASSQREYEGLNGNALFEFMRRFLEEQFIENVRPSSVPYVGIVKNFSPSDFLPLKEVKRTDRFQHLALAASEMAKRDAGLSPWVHETYPSERIAVVAGSSMGGNAHMGGNIFAVYQSGAKGCDPFLHDPVSGRHGGRGNLEAPGSKRPGGMPECGLCDGCPGRG